MTAHHQIDHESKLIATYWDGNVADNKFISALKQYQTEIKNKSDLCSYNEIVDLSCISTINLNVKEIMTLADIAARSDLAIGKNKLALVVSSNIAFSFGMMYSGYRKLLSKSNKEVKVFKKKSGGDILD